MEKRKWTQEEVWEWMKKNHTIIYYNPNDTNIVVRKRHGLGWTMNMGNPMSYVAAVGFAAVLYCVMHFAA